MPCMLDLSPNICTFMCIGDSLNMRPKLLTCATPLQGTQFQPWTCFSKCCAVLTENEKVMRAFGFYWFDEQDIKICYQRTCIER